MIVALISAAVFWNGEPGIRLFVLNMYASIAHFYLLPLPMFVFLGEVVFHSGMGFRIFAHFLCLLVFVTPNSDVWAYCHTPLR
jgi:hypothetical protein